VIEHLFAIELAVLGLVFGSFLNVVIARLPKEESIVRPGSKCPKCGTPIAWYDNVPVLSWVLLRGKCRHCKAPISPRYVFVELITGALFMAALWRFGWTWNLVMALTFIILVVPLIFIDAEHWILPFELTVPGIALGLILRIPQGKAAIVTGVIGAVSAYVAFRIMEYLGWLFSRREALGAGDKFLLALIGAFLGWRPLLGVIALSSFQGAVYGVARILVTGRAAAELPAKDGEEKKDAEEAKAGTPPTPETPPGEAQPDGEAQPAGEAKPDGEAQPDGEAKPDGEDEGELEEATFTPDFLRPGVSFFRRLLLIPWTLFLQPIPDEPEVEETEGAEGESGTEAAAEAEWTPGVTNMPFGPWIALAALELMLIGPWVVAHAGEGALGSMVRMMFGS